MSMSTLSNQLSALSSKSSSGTVHSSSRATNDSIGRGFHHSSQHGHSLLGAGGKGADNAVGRAPSVLYGNAREASEISVVTLRENAVGALESLAASSAAAAGASSAAADDGLWTNPEFIGGRGLLSPHQLSNFERGTATRAQNALVDESIERLLALLTTVVCDVPPPRDGTGDGVDSNPTLLAALHVVEYLLRHYSAHSRPGPASALIAAFLPLQVGSPTAYPALFGRLLNLVDLQSVPEWTWLRKHAARGAPPLGRGELSKRVSKDNALVKIVAEIGRKGMEICVLEGRVGDAGLEDFMQIDREGGSSSGVMQKRGGALAVRRGISTLLSFSASILVEAIHIQSTSTSVGTSGGVQEPLVRTLFPLIVSACKSGSSDTNYCPEWKEWGRLLAATCATMCPLTGVVKGALCDAIVEGLPTSAGMKTKKAFQQAVLDIVGNSTSMSAKEMDDATSAIMTLLSVLSTMNNANRGGTDSEDGDGWEYYLPMLPPRGKKKKSIVDYLGCELPVSTYKLISRRGNGGVACALGAMLQHDDEEGRTATLDQMLPLVASIVMHAFVSLEKEAGKALSTLKKSKRKSKVDAGADAKFKGDKHVLLILSLIQEPSLSALWSSKHSSLVAALTVHTITSYDNLNHSQDAQGMILTRYSSILKALTGSDSVVFDQGVAYTVNTITVSNNLEGSKTKKEHQLTRLAQLLGRNDISLLSSGDAGSKNGSQATEDATDFAISSLLPTRVALENADASVRLDAISRIKSSIENKEGVGEGLGQALLRRLATDDNVNVASAAGELVASQLKLAVEQGQEDGMEEDGSLAFASLGNNVGVLAKEALASLMHWTIIRKDDDVWSPMTNTASVVESGKKKKGRRKSKGGSDAKEDSGSYPLLSCIDICGSVAKLILAETSMDSLIIEKPDHVDDDDSIRDLLCMIFLSLGAHVNVGNGSDGSAVSRAACAELLQLFHNDEGNSYANMADLITSNSVSQFILIHSYGGDSLAKLPGTTDVKKLLQERFLWLALHSYSNRIGMPSSEGEVSDFLPVALDLAINQMQSYTKESKIQSTFEWEIEFLCEICKKHLSLSANEDFEKAILKLASTSSNVSFDKIVKPAILSRLSSKSITLLLRACLQPHADKDGIPRILGIAQESLSIGKASMDLKVARDCIIPTLALLSHPDRKIRELVISMLEQIQSSVEKDEVLFHICSKATDIASPLRSSLIMDGANSLPNLLGEIVRFSGSSSATHQKFLIESCKSCALSENREFSNGGCEAAAILLSGLEKAGENAFPLLQRWNFAGKELFQALLTFNLNGELELSSLYRLRDCVLSMMKGVLVNESQAGDDGLSMQISIGPSQTGRRMRSYSIGASGSFTTLEPYPKDMLAAILKGLSASDSPLLLSKHITQLVIVRQSWANGVFPKLDSKSKHAIASALLALRTQENNEFAGSAILGLPLKTSDFIQLLEEVDASQSEIDQAAVVFITDCIRGKLDFLGSTADICKLSSKLFDQLLSLSSVKNLSASEGDSGGRDYTRVSILQTLYSIHSQYKHQLSKPLNKNGGKHGSARKKRSRPLSDVGSPKALASQAELLVGLVGGNASATQQLNSGRGRALSLSLLTCLCEESPAAVVTSLLPALMSLAGASPSGDTIASKEIDMKAIEDALIAIVPAYCMYAESANLSLFSLLESFIRRIIFPGSQNEKSTYAMLDHLANSLKRLPTKESSSDATASLAACVMALQAFNIQKPTVASDTDSEIMETDHDSQTRLHVRVLDNMTSGVRISVSVSLLQYAEKLMSYICGLSTLSAPSGSTMKVDIAEVATLALRGSNGEERDPFAAFSELSEAEQRSILYFAINLLQSVRDALSTQSARRAVRKGKGDDADLCLRLWNELMQTHTNTLRAQSRRSVGPMGPMEKKFWEAAPIATSDCLENLQNLLPVPHFLASVSSALADDAGDTYIRKKSIRLLADRVTDLSPDSPEASLFLEMVPDLVAQVNVGQSSDNGDSLGSKRRIVVMQQGALIAIESFVRSLYPSNENGKLAANAAAVFLPALDSVTKLLDNTASSWIKANREGGRGVSSGVADAECQLLSSSSLCISTLVTTLKVRCLPQLPSIIKPLVVSLKSVNSLLEGTNDQAAVTGELLQLSILKTLQAIAVTLPQFLLPYLPLVFSDDALPSKALRQGHEQADHSVRSATMQVEAALATKVQIRQLIPALTQALTKNLQSEGSDNWQDACSIINVMNIAVESSQRSQLSPIIGKVFNGLVMAYGYEGNAISRPQMLRGANKCLLSLVMKLSETQLRPLYARLREWRGDIEDESEGSVSSVRRYAFWSLSAELSKSLRSIFLPCLTSVLTDVIDELEIAVSLLCQRTKKADGSKRRITEATNVSIEDMGKVESLQPLLLCLESALKADAHEGGDWTRGDDSQRYNMILNHLGKLLQAQVPKEIPLLSDLTPKEQAANSAYQQLVQGVGTLEHGNVVGCLTALAAAAGNEQLWKPLNFAVLEACGHKRSEVRKAGISCLLSIIETIGEEYMVLLPECLPIISELLEDDEEIAGMAKECVRQGEELLGESLEDSLR